MRVKARSLGPNTKIVQALQDYGSVSLDFLEDVTGVEHAVAVELIKNLEEKGILERQDDHVSLKVNEKVGS